MRVHLGGSPSVDVAVNQRIPLYGGITSLADTLYYKCDKVETGGNQRGGRFKHQHEILLNTAAIVNENPDQGNTDIGDGSGVPCRALSRTALPRKALHSERLRESEPIGGN